MSTDLRELQKGGQRGEKSMEDVTQENSWELKKKRIHNDFILGRWKER